jgi:hypothetical protein
MYIGQKPATIEKNRGRLCNKHRSQLLLPFPGLLLRHYTDSLAVKEKPQCQKAALTPLRRANAVVPDKSFLARLASEPDMDLTESFFATCLVGSMRFSHILTLFPTPYVQLGRIL